jgi:hypothetical protein
LHMSMSSSSRSVGFPMLISSFGSKMSISRGMAMTSTLLSGLKSLIHRQSPPYMHWSSSA